MVQLYAICQGENNQRLAVQLEGREAEMGVRGVESREIVHNHARREG